MRKERQWWLLIALALAACATQLSPQQQLDRLGLGLTAGYKQVASNVRSGTMNDTERMKAIGQLDELGEQVDKAQSLLDLGDLRSAEAQIRLLQTALPKLQQELAARARKEKRP